MKDVLIRFTRNDLPCENANDAKKFLNEKVNNEYGQPVSISYYKDDSRTDLNYIYAIGTKKGIGPGSYFIVTSHSEVLIDGIVENNIPEIEKLVHGELYIYRHTDGIVYKIYANGNERVEEEVEDNFKCYNLDDNIHYYIFPDDIIPETTLAKANASCNCKPATSGKPGQLSYVKLLESDYQELVDNGEVDESTFYFILHSNGSKILKIYLGTIPYDPSSYEISVDNLRVYSGSTLITDTVDIIGTAGKTITINKYIVNVDSNFDCTTATFKIYKSGTTEPISEQSVDLAKEELISINPVDITIKNGEKYTFELTPTPDSSKSSSISTASKTITGKYSTPSITINKVYINNNEVSSLSGTVTINKVKLNCDVTNAGNLTSVVKVYYKTDSLSNYTTLGSSDGYSVTDYSNIEIPSDDISEPIKLTNGEDISFRIVAECINGVNEQDSVSNTKSITNNTTSMSFSNFTITGLTNNESISSDEDTTNINLSTASVTLLPDSSYFDLGEFNISCSSSDNVISITNTEISDNVATFTLSCNNTIFNTGNTITFTLSGAGFNDEALGTATVKVNTVFTEPENLVLNSLEFYNSEYKVLDLENTYKGDISYDSIKANISLGLDSLGNIKGLNAINSIKLYVGDSVLATIDKNDFTNNTEIEISGSNLNTISISEDTSYNICAKVTYKQYNINTKTLNTNNILSSEVKTITIGKDIVSVVYGTLYLNYDNSPLSTESDFKSTLKSIVIEALGGTQTNNEIGTIISKVNDNGYNYLTILNESEFGYYSSTDENPKNYSFNDNYEFLSNNTNLLWDSDKVDESTMIDDYVPIGIVLLTNDKQTSSKIVSYDIDSKSIAELNTEGSENYFVLNDEDNTSYIFNGTNRNISTIALASINTNTYIAFTKLN